MQETTPPLPSTTLEKFAQLARLLQQASLLAREISQGSERFNEIIPQDQQWFWTDAWQAIEREVDEQLKRGQYHEFDNMEALIADLHHHV